MSNISNYLFFDGNCAEAMAFYQECFGGKLTVTKVSDSPVKDRMPAEYQQKVLYASLKEGPVELSASDWLTSDRGMIIGNRTSIVLSEFPRGELDRYFDRLSRGATRIEPISKQFFGDFGVLTDRYGVGWMFIDEST